MLIILILLLAGIILGRLLHNKQEIIIISDRLTTWSIYLLLFLLGVSIGTNNQILSNLSSLGLSAMVLTGFALAGSILLSVVTYNFFFRNHKQ